MRISDWSSDVCSSDLIEAARLAAARPSGIEHRIVARLVIPRYSPGKATGLVPVIPIACGRGEDCGYQVDIFVSGADQCRIERDIISAELRSLFRLGLPAQPGGQRKIFCYLYNRLADPSRSDERREGKTC